MAVNLPSAVKKNIGSFIQDLRQSKSDMRWVKPENLHLTVQFLGNVHEKRVPAVTEALEKAAAGVAPFTLDLGGVGVFPSRERPRVFWVGVSGDIAVLQQLNRQVQGELKQLDFDPGKNRFSPHLTLARLRSPAGFVQIMARAEKIAAGKTFGVADIATVDLMLSKLGPKGPKYRLLACVPLIGAAEAY